MQHPVFSTDETGAGGGNPAPQPDEPQTPAVEAADAPHPAAEAEVQIPSVEAVSAASADAPDDTWWLEAATADEPQATGDSGSAAASGDESAITTPLPTTAQPADLPPAATPAAPFEPSTHGLAFSAQRDIGQIRSINQDSVFGMIATVPRASGDVPIGIFIVADGMGGHDGGEVASRMAISTAAYALLADLVIPSLDEAMTDSIQSMLTKALQEANRAIWSAAQANGTDMGTTCTAAILIGHTVYIGHIGDSRAYLVMPDRMKQLTSDHSAVGRLIELGQLSPEDSREHPMRSHLYRTVGQSPEVAVDYDYSQTGDASHLLLCSDGLWSMLDDPDLHRLISSTIWPADACRALIAHANAAGGEDNISAIVVSLG